MPSVVRASSTIKSYSEPHELIVIHESSTIESGAPRIDCLPLFVYPPPPSPEPPRIDCLALFLHPPPSYSEPHELIVIHSSSVIKYGASGEGKIRVLFCYFLNRFLHQTCVYVYIMLLVFFLCLFCVVQRKKEDRWESSWTNHEEGEDGRNQCFIFAFLLSLIKGK